MTIPILYQDEDIVVVDKPYGFHVHPPEDGYPVPRSLICLYQVRDAVGQHIYPVHRIDASTTGLLIFAKSSAAASKICVQFAAQGVRKSYWAIARGHLAKSGSIDIPLASDSSKAMLEAKTSYVLLATTELPYAVGKRFSTARYSWLEVSPVTGRFHQIRRHFSRISHPLVGDGEHGDSKHNTFFREVLRMPGLCLRAQNLELIHPRTREWVQFQAPASEKWTKIRSLFKDFDVIQEQQ